MSSPNTATVPVSSRTVDPHRWMVLAVSASSPHRHCWLCSTPPS
ncbi:MAG TPA: hypothetical protein VGM01_06515 [Ktedonobacteraceae bacterium]